MSNRLQQTDMNFCLKISQMNRSAISLEQRDRRVERQRLRRLLRIVEQINAANQQLFSEDENPCQWNRPPETCGMSNVQLIIGFDMV